MNSARVFIPHKECWVASGACFDEGRCLHKCQPTLPRADANSDLATALRLLRNLTDYTIGFREMTRYVDGSSIDNAVNEAKALMRKHKP